MEFIQILITAAGIVFVLVLILWLISSIYSRQRERILRSPKIGKNNALDLCLKDITYGKNVIADRYFPEPDEDDPGIRRYRRIDHIVVGSGGVILMTLCREKGKIDNRAPDVWVAIKDDSRREFTSPMIKLEKCAELVKKLLERRGFKDPRVFKAVVFTDPQTIPIEKTNGTVLLSELEMLIKGLNDEKNYDLLEKFFIINTLKQASISRDKAENLKNEKNGEKQK